MLSDEERQEKKRIKWRRNYKVKYEKYREQENKRWHNWYDAHKDEFNAHRRERRRKGKGEQE